MLSKKDFKQKLTVEIQPKLLKTFLTKRDSNGGMCYRKETDYPAGGYRIEYTEPDFKFLLNIMKSGEVQWRIYLNHFNQHDTVVDKTLASDQNEYEDEQATKIIKEVVADYRRFHTEKERKKHYYI